MDVAANLVGNGFRAVIDHPGEAVAEEIALVRSQAGNDLVVQVLRPLPEGLVSEQDPCQVGDVLARAGRSCNGSGKQRH